MKVKDGFYTLNRVQNDFRTRTELCGCIIDVGNLNSFVSIETFSSLREIKSLARFYRYDSRIKTKNMCLNKSSCKVKSEKYYEAHRLRSHPFKCISLPLWGIFFFIFFWFALVPIIYVLLNMKHGKEWPSNWIYFFWAICFVIFLIVLCLLICLWRCNPRKKNRDETDELIPNSNTSKTQDIYSQTLTADAIKAPKDNKERIGTNVTPKRNTEAIPVCNVKRRLDKKRPESVNLTRVHEPQKYRSLYYGETSPLTPRELFFFDLMKSAHESERSLTYSFIENEKKANTLTHPRSSQTDNKGSKEYFIANVTTPDKCTNEVFLFIENDKSEKKFVIRENDL